MSRETDSIIDVMVASGIPHVVTDINTPGDHTSTGNHYKADVTPAPPRPIDAQRGRVGRAVDFAHRRHDGKRDSPELFAIWRFWADNYVRAGVLNELYYSGPGAECCVRYGRWMRWADVPEPARSNIRGSHHDHVHVALNKGVVLTVPKLQPKPEEEDMPDKKTSACMAPSKRGCWVLDRDGAVETKSFDKSNPVPFCGSMHDYPDEQKVPGRYYIHIEPFGDRDEDGYWIISSDGGRFHPVRKR